VTNQWFVQTDCAFGYSHSKISADALKEAIQAVLTASAAKKRGFEETIELQITMKNYDSAKEKRFTGTVRLPFIPRPRFTVAVIGDAKHLQEAQAINVPGVSVDDLKKMNKNKKAVKKLARSYGAFVASASLIRQIPRILGPGLNKAGKFPSVLGANENIQDKITATKQSVKVQLKAKKALQVGFAVANVGMSKDDIEANINMAVNFAVNMLPKGWNQIKRLYIKSTMGPVQRIYGF